MLTKSNKERLKYIFGISGPNSTNSTNSTKGNKRKENPFIRCSPAFLVLKHFCPFSCQFKTIFQMFQVFWVFQVPSIYQPVAFPSRKTVRKYFRNEEAQQKKKFRIESCLRVAGKKGYTRLLLTMAIKSN